MKIRLGYVSKPITIDETASSLMTYSYYKKLKKDKFKKLDEIIKSNFISLQKILNYNLQNQIHFYRMTSSLIPLGTHKDVKYEIFKRYKNEFKQIGEFIKKNNLRIDMHPNQFCVLNSATDEVIESTIKYLNFYYNIYKAMDIKSILILHIGSSYGGKDESIKRFKNSFNLLPPKIKKTIVLENDDKTFNIKDTLKLCNELNIPFVLDYHHYKCNNEKERIEDYIISIFKTWKITPKIHFSSPKNKKEFRNHHDYIDCDEFIKFIEKIKFTKIDLDIMLEAKAKDEALFRLVRQLKYKTNYKFIDNTTFLI